MSGRFVVFAVIAGLLLGGCGGSVGDPPRSSSSAPSTVLPTSPPSSSAPPAPATPTVPADVPTTGPNLKVKGERPPVMPVAATEHTRAGAVSFAEFFIKTMDWGYASVSSTYMRHYFTGSCVECTSIAAAVDGVAEKQRRFIGDRITLTPGTTAAVAPGGYTIIVAYAVASGEVVDSHGQFVDGAPAFNATDRISVEWTRSGWSVVNMVPVN